MPSYVMLLPLLPVTVKLVEVTVEEIDELDMLQVPVVEVTHLADPPGLKLPVIVALGTTKPELRSRTSAVEVACQFLPAFWPIPFKLLMATV
mgnify:CR=1 FL=1